MSTAASPAQREFDSDVAYHRYEPHRAGLPDLTVYFRELWRRREFANETSKAGMRGANSMTFFGQAWLVINPLLLAFVYYLLVTVIAGARNPNSRGFDAQYFSHLTGGLFAYYFLQGCVSAGAGSVTGAGKLILNTAFPRLLLPLGAVRTGFFRFLPTLPVYFVFHLLAHNPWNVATMLVAPFFLFLLAMFSAGLAALFAALQVYFRDTAAFLPYILRIWLYISPVLWMIKDLNEAAQLSTLHRLAMFNPLYSILGGYGQALQEGIVPQPIVWALAIFWAVAACLVGFGYFMSRERDFAVRL